MQSKNVTPFSLAAQSSSSHTTGEKRKHAPEEKKTKETLKAVYIGDKSALHILESLKVNKSEYSKLIRKFGSKIISKKT